MVVFIAESKKMKKLPPFDQSLYSSLFDMEEDADRDNATGNYPPIPMAVFNNFFCVGFEGAYQKGEGLDLTDLFTHYIAQLLCHNDQDEIASKWDRAPISQKTNFEYIEHTDENNCSNLFLKVNFQSGFENFIFLFGIKRNPMHGVSDVYSTLIGMERDNHFNVIYSSCLFQDTHGNKETQVIENADGLYASLCYSHRIMSSCLAKEELKLDDIQAWMMNNIAFNERTMFDRLCSQKSVADAITMYHQGLPSGSGSSIPVHYPQRHLN